MHDALRLFLICRAMEWNHLPAPGGLYDQDPKLLSDFQVLWGLEAEAQQEDTKQKKIESARQNRPGSAL